MVVSRKFKQFLSSKRNKFNSSRKILSSKKTRRRIIVRRTDDLRGLASPDIFDFLDREVESHRRITQNFPALDQGIDDTFVSAQSSLVGLQNEADAIDRATEDAIPKEI